ncbi:hypothetical protein D3C85_1466140 [compost metagenome]
MQRPVAAQCTRVVASHVDGDQHRVCPFPAVRAVDRNRARYALAECRVRGVRLVAARNDNISFQRDNRHFIACCRIIRCSVECFDRVLVRRFFCQTGIRVARRCGRANFRSVAEDVIAGYSYIIR